MTARALIDLGDGFAVRVEAFDDVDPDEPFDVVLAVTDPESDDSARFGVHMTPNRAREVARALDAIAELANCRSLQDYDGWLEQPAPAAPSELHLTDLTNRTYNALRRARIDTIEQLTGKSAGDLLDIRGFGHRALDDVLAMLGAHGLALRPDVHFHPSGRPV